jgi:hypothetical protein
VAVRGSRFPFARTMHGRKRSITIKPPLKAGIAAHCKSVG